MSNKPSFRKKLAEFFCLTPYSVWAVLFIVVPLIFVAYYALTDNQYHFTLDNLKRFFTATSVVGDTEIHTYIVIFMRSLKLAVISTVFCFLLGYPLAYIISRSSAKVQSVLITLIMIPMWMNFLIRTSAERILSDGRDRNGKMPERQRVAQPRTVTVSACCGASSFR